MMSYNGMHLGPTSDPAARRYLRKPDVYLRQLSVAMKNLASGNNPKAKVTTGAPGSAGNPGSGGNLPDHDHHATGFGGNILGIFGGAMSALGSWVFASLATFSASIKVPTGAAVGKAMVSDATGVGSWATLDNTYLADRLRHLYLPAAVFNQANGTLSTLQSGAIGVYPVACALYPMVDNPVSSPQGFNTTLVVPQDYVPGSAIQFWLHWTETTVNIVDTSWVFRYHYRVVDDKQDMKVSWTTTSNTIVDNGATGSGGSYDAGAIGFHANTRLVDIPSTGLAAGQMIALTVDRLSTDANDNLHATVGFIGVELRYTADM